MSENGTMKAGVVGCGLAATWAHIPALTAIPEVELVSVCDADLAKAKQVAADFGVRSAYGDATEMLEKESLDLLHVLTNPESHLELALQAMDAGCNVLIEKPFVYTAEEADRAIAKASETGTRFTVIHNDLFMPAAIELRARIAAGEIGTLTSVQFLSSLRDQRRVAKPWYYKIPGGRLGETLPHALFLLVDLIDGLEVRHVDARRLGYSMPPDGVDERDTGIDELHVQLVADRATASIFYGFNSFFPDSVLACGTDGHLIAHSVGGVTQLPARELGAGDLIAITRSLAVKVFRKVGLLRTTARDRALGSSHYRQIHAYVRHLREGTDYAVTERKAREVVALWERIVSAYSP